MELSRRQFIGLMGTGAAIGVTGTFAFDKVAAADSGTQSPTVPFYGEHQAGIATPAQDRLHFAAFDIHTEDRNAVIEMLKKWTSAAAQMTAGDDVGKGGAVGGPASAPPEDTGEALGLHAARLTLTFGFGTSFFANSEGKDRFGIAHLRPAAFADLPLFPRDKLDPARSGGDLMVQACADDPQVAVHAIRNLARLARGTAVVRYSQLGFGRTSSTSTAQATPRNLMGFKDGTANIKLEDDATLRDQVWVQRGDGSDWMTGGTYLVSRRIRMLIEPWDTTPLDEQERVIGRTKGEGNAFGSAHEFDDIRLDALGKDGSPMIAEDSHVRLAHPTSNGGAKLLRRGYSFVDGTDELGRLDAGLFFLAYQRDPRNQFVRINQTLSGKHGDALNEYIQHVSSGLFACPPGVQPNHYWGETLLA